MKKICVVILIIALLLSGSAYITKNGDNLGDVYSTDIRTTIDGYPISCYTIDGRTVIPLEDLGNYGFQISFDELTRTLDVRTDVFPAHLILPEVSQQPAGKVLGCYSYTDIIACVNGIRIPSYNFQGKTYAAVEDLGGINDSYNASWGFSDYNMNYIWDETSRTMALNCFRFLPESELGRVLHNAEAMVTQPEYGVYTEGAPEEAPYYGAPLEPRSGIYAGINADGNGWPDGEGRLFPHGFASYSNYVEFDERQDYFFKPGSLFLPEADCLTLAPWNLTNVEQVFENEPYIRRTLDYMASFQKPVIVRFGAEMNVSSIGDSPSAYVKAFRMIADIVHEYPNFAVMWSVNDLGGWNRLMSYYYPGDEYVDWIGISSFMKRDFMENPSTTRTDSMLFMTGDFAWHTNCLKPILQFMEENNIHKPVAISEGAVTSGLSYSSEKLTSWAEPRLRAMYWNVAMRYPQVKMITYFNNSHESEEIQYSLYGHANYIAIIEEALQNGPYLLSYSQKNPRFTFVHLAGQRLPAGCVPLYTYAYLPEETVNSVIYQIDGADICQRTEIPYRYEANLSDIEDGSHILSVGINGSNSTHTLTYPFVKEKDDIFFIIN